MERDNEPRVPFEYQAQMDEAMRVASTGNFYGAIRWLRYASELDDQVSYAASIQLSAFMTTLHGGDPAMYAEQFEQAFIHTGAIDLSAEEERRELFAARTMGKSGAWLVKLYEAMQTPDFNDKIIDQAFEWLLGYEGTLSKQALNNPEKMVELAAELEAVTHLRQSFGETTLQRAIEPQSSNLGALALHLPPETES